MRITISNLLSVFMANTFLVTLCRTCNKQIKTSVKDNKFNINYKQQRNSN